MKRNQQLKNVLRNFVKNGTDRTKLRLIYVKRGDVPKPYIYICVRLRENRAQRGVRNIEKRSIDFLKMYCLKPTEGNG